MPPCSLEKLVRDTHRAELQALAHPVREARRLGDAPPITALRDVALHAAIMRPRFEAALDGHGVAPPRGGLGATLSALRLALVERVVDPERSYRTVLLDLRCGLEVVARLRDVARRERVFGLIRWSDDWLGARRTLVARVEAQLGWFAARDALVLGPSPVPGTSDHVDHHP